MLLAAQASVVDMDDESPKPITPTRLDTKDQKFWEYQWNPSDVTVFINVCGMVFETQQKTLNKFPMTLLGDDNRRNLYSRKEQNDHYFDRHRDSFGAILYYYQSGGILIRPTDVPYEVFEKEVEFFDLGSHVISKLKESEGYTEEEDPLIPTNKLQRKVWELFEVPESGIAARIMMIFSALVIILSVFIFCLDSLPGYGKSHHASCNNTTSQVPGTNQCGYNYLELMELACVVWFTFEYVIRFTCSPDKWMFLQSWFNVIDLLAIIPYFVVTAIGRNASPLAMIRLLRTARIFRVFKLSRYSTNLQLMGKTLRASFNELCMLAFFLLFGIIIFSSALFYAENEENPNFFPSIPETFWFALVTMTTVGYGDKVPMTTVGKIIGGMCACSGVLMVAMVVPVIVTNFERYYKTRNNTNKTMKNNVPEEQPLCNGAVKILR